MTDPNWDKHLDPPDEKEYPKCQACNGIGFAKEDGIAKGDSFDRATCDECNGKGYIEPSDPREEPEYHEDR